MKLAAIAGSALLLASVHATTAHAQTCRSSAYGIPVKVTFVSGKRVRFCLNSRCSTGTYGGSRNGKMAFGNSAFRFTMTKRKRGYRYTLGGRGLPSIGGTMRCR